MIGFIIGLFVGAFLGVFVMALCFMAKDSDERAEEIRRKEGIQ